MPFPDAFRREDESALLSQAASLLLLGAQLDEAPVALEAAASLRGEPPMVGFAPPEDAEPLRVPRVAATGERFERRRLVDVFLGVLEAAPEEVRETAPEALSVLAEAVEAKPSPLTATALIAASTQHPWQVVRIAAAVAGLSAVADPLPLVDVLAEGSRSDDPLVRDMAATGLARFDPEHPALAALREPPPPSGAGEPSHTSLLVHGTFARTARWWQPGGEFHEYLRAEVRPDLYSATDRFEWSGGYSDAARALAARDLQDWVRTRGLQGLDVLAHSYGGNAAMLATQNGLDLGQLVLLSCPVHANKYFPDFAQVREVVSVRVRLDLVTLVDRGGQRFRDPRIRENVLPIWFRHSDTHVPEVWRRHDVPGML